MSERFLTANLASLTRAGSRDLTGWLTTTEADGELELDAGAVAGVSLRTARGLVRLHGRRDPVAEAGRLLPAGDREAGLVAVIGAGAGFVLDALERRGSGARVLLLEPSVASLKAMLSRRSWEASIDGGRLRVLAGPGYEGWMDLSSWVGAAGEAPPLVVHPVIARERPDEVRRAADVLKRLLFNASANEAARNAFAGPYLLNTLANLRQLVASRDVGELFGRFAGVPAFVLAAGPSLNRNLEELKPHRDSALVMAVDTALRPCLAAGVEPDLVVGVDPGEANLRHLAVGAAPLRTHLVGEPSLAPGSFDAFGDRVFTFRVDRHHPWPWLQEQGIDRATLLAWGSVLTTTLDLAVKLCCSPVVLFGADFAYTDGQPYCRGTAYEEDWARAVEAGERLEDVWRRCMRQPVVVEPGIDGREVETSAHLQAFRDWVVAFCRKHGEVAFVNGTGAGVLRECGAGSQGWPVKSRAPEDGPRTVDPLRVLHSGRVPDADAVRGLRAAVHTMLLDCGAADPYGWPERWTEVSQPAELWHVLREFLPEGAPARPMGRAQAATGGNPPFSRHLEMHTRDLVEFYRPPTWSTGHVSQEDALFLDAIVRRVAPASIIEVGVASGCSSAVLLRALASLGGERALHSFDILDYCYMAPDRPLGAAVDELVPEQRHRWRLHQGEAAIHAGQRLAGQEVTLAFIDADHRHPWPTLDLWALLPALAPDAWVVLHDIVLARISEWQVLGPQHLFECWPGEKAESVGQGNIGAIRLPGDLVAARGWLKAALQRPWEVAVAAPLLDRLGIPVAVRPDASFTLLPPTLRASLGAARAARRALLVWGAGSRGRACVEAMIACGLRPDALIDSDPSKHGRHLEGVTVEPVGDLSHRHPRPFVVVASLFAPQIVERFDEWGFREGRDYACVSCESVPGDVAALPETDTPPGLLGMTTGEEQRYLFEYARDRFLGTGAIVDLGCWLGSTTIPLARGLEAARAAPAHLVHAFDTFVWHEWMDRHAGDLAGRFAPGDSFLQEFQRRLGPEAPRVHVHPGDLTKGRWAGGPIEFLLVDAMKTWDLCAAITRGFLPHVIPGAGLVMHQDFKFWGCPWIHLTMYRLRDCFVMERDLARSAGTVFRLVRAPTEHLLAALGQADFNAEDIDDAFTHWKALLRGPLVSQLDLARILALGERGERTRVAAGLDHWLDAGGDLPELFVTELQRQVPDLNVAILAEPWERSLDRAVAEGRPVWMWGAAAGGRRALKRSARLRSALSGVIDRDPTKVGGRLEDAPVLAPTCLDDGATVRPFVVVATAFALQVQAELRRRGFERGRDFCAADLS